MQNISQRTRLLTEAGLLIALALVLDYISGLLPRIWAQGGSLNLAYLPIILYSVRNFSKPHGAIFSLLVGLISRGMVMLWAGGIYHPLSAVLDYLLIGLIFGAIGVVTKFKLGDFTECSIVVFGLLALFSHVVSGVVLFAAYMPDVYFGMEMTNAWFYSLLYNMTHMVPSIILAVFLYALLPKNLKVYSSLPA